MYTRPPARLGVSVCPTLALLVLGCSVLHAQPPPPGPQLPPGTVRLQVRPGASGQFRLIPGSQNTWEAGPFEVQGESPLRHWSIVCEVSPLRNLQTGELIPAARVEIVSAQVPAGTRMRLPLPVLQGGIGTSAGPSGTSSFVLRVVTDWNDPPGTYSATVRFSYLASP